MPFVKPVHRSIYSFAESEVSLDVQRRLWQNQPDFWGEVIPAAFTLENTVGALRERMRFPLSGHAPDPKFDAFDPELNRGTVFEDYPELLADVTNLEDWKVKKLRVEREMEDLQTVNRSPHALGAFLLAGLIDPVNLIPVGAAAPKTARALLDVSANRLAWRTFSRGAQAGFVGNLAAEAVLQKSQNLRTPIQTGANVVSGALFGAMVGGVMVPLAIARRLKAETWAYYGESVGRGRPASGTPQFHVREDLRARADEPEPGTMVPAVRNAQTGEVFAGGQTHGDVFERFFDPEDESLQLQDGFWIFEEGGRGRFISGIQEVQEAARKLHGIEPSPMGLHSTQLKHSVSPRKVEFRASDDPDAPLTIADIDAARHGTIVDPKRPIIGLSEAEQAVSSQPNWHWIENQREVVGESAHTTTFVPWNRLRGMLPEGTAQRLAPAEEGILKLRRIRLYVIERNPNRPTQHVASEMKVVAFQDSGSLGHLRALPDDLDPVIPVEIVVLKNTKKLAKMLEAGQFDPIEASVKRFPKGKTPDAVSWGWLHAHDRAKEPVRFRLERSITCASPCSTKSQQDLLDEGHVVPGGYQDDGTIGVSREAEEIDTTGAYNPDVSATEAEIVSAMGVEKLVRFMFPSLRLATSHVRLIRQVAPKLLDMQLRMGQFAEGTAKSRSAELGMKMWNRVLGQLVEIQDRGWVEYRMELAGKKFKPDQGLNAQVLKYDALDRLRGAPEGVMTKHQFFEEVGRAMRRQLDGEAGSTNPHVERVARETRKRYDALFSAAEDVGLMDPIVRVDAEGNPTTRVFNERGEATGESYFRRVFKKRLLAKPEERVAFIRTVADRWQEKYDMQPKEAYEAAERVYDQIMGTASARTPERDIAGLSEVFKKPEYMKFRQPSSTRPRSLDLHDFEIERWLEDDVQLVTRFLFRTMVPDIEIGRVFGNVDPETGRWKGDPNMRFTLDHVRREIARQVKERKARGDPAHTVSAFEKRANKDMEDLANLRDLLRGQYAVPANPEHGAYQFLQSFRMVNYLTMGGGFMLSSVPDVARLVTVNGLGHTFNTALNILSTPANVRKGLLAEARLSGTAWETLLNQRAANVFDLSDDYSRMSRVQLGLRAAADRFAALSLLSPWNDMMKRWAGLYTGQLMANDIEAYVAKAATKDQMERLAYWGFNHDVIQKIWHQIDGKKLPNGIWHLDTPNWNNAAAKDAFRMALGSEIDRTIITPNAGDVPLFLNTEVGRTIFQFKRFAYAATKTMAFSGLQWKDAKALNGTLLGIAMGAMVAQAKARQYGYTIRSSKELLLSAVDRSGVLGILPDINASLGYISNGDLSPGQFVFGGHNRYIWSNRDWKDVLLGPSMGTIRNLATAGEGLAKVAGGNWDQVREREIRAAARLTSLYSLFYLTRLYEIGIKQMAAPGVRARRRARQAMEPSAGENEALLRTGEFTYLEMAFEDGGVDQLVETANERHDFHHDTKPLTTLEQSLLRERFTEKNIAGLKAANDEDGIAGMVRYLKSIAGVTG